MSGGPYRPSGGRYLPGAGVSAPLPRWLGSSFGSHTPRLGRPFRWLTAPGFPARDGLGGRGAVPGLVGIVAGVPLAPAFIGSRRLPAGEDCHRLHRVALRRFGFHPAIFSAHPKYSTTLARVQEGICIFAVGPKPAYRACFVCSHSKKLAIGPQVSAAQREACT